MKITKVKIILENSDGTHSEVTETMPYEIAYAIECAVIDWENKWAGSVLTVKEFLREEEKLKEQSKPQPE